MAKAKKILLHKKVDGAWVPVLPTTSASNVIFNSRGDNIKTIIGNILNPSQNLVRNSNSNLGFDFWKKVKSNDFEIDNISGTFFHNTPVNVEGECLESFDVPIDQGVYSISAEMSCSEETHGMGIEVALYNNTTFIISYFLNCEIHDGKMRKYNDNVTVPINCNRAVIRLCNGATGVSTINKRWREIKFERGEEFSPFSNEGDIKALYELVSPISSIGSFGRQLLVNNKDNISESMVVEDDNAWCGKAVKLVNNSTDMTSFEQSITDLKYNKYIANFRLSFSATSTLGTDKAVIAVYKKNASIKTLIAKQSLDLASINPNTFNNFYLIFDYIAPKSTNNELIFALELNSNTVSCEARVDYIEVYPKL